MFRGLVLAIALLTTSQSAAAQVLSVLHIKVVIVDTNGQAMPVPRYRLQISDNPASAPPRRVITSLEGVVDVRLPPGNYTVESERPFAPGGNNGKSYQWTMVVDVAVGRDSTLELNSNNAEVGSAADSPEAVASPTVADPSSLLARWQDSLAAIWTATTHGSGFLIDSNGLIAADQQVIGAATSVEVQLSPAIKVSGTVVASDVMRGIALVRINPSIALTGKVLPLECDQTPAPLAVGQEIIALEAPLARQRGTRAGSIESALANVIDTDLVSSASGSGGPVFAADGRLIGLTTLAPEREAQRLHRTRIVRIRRLCEFITSAAEKIKNTPPPSATPLPVESLRAFPSSSAGVGAGGRPGLPPLYRMATADFDIAFITPVQLIAHRDSGDLGAARAVSALGAAQPLIGFSNWTEYVEGTPPVLLIRVTPKFAEGFWTKVARGVAMTQGVAIPSIKRPKGDFGRMRALCGDNEIVPVHPFKIEHRLSDKETLVEGLYAFDPGALTPACATVRLELFSEKDARTPDTLVVDPKVIQQLWQDFAPLRSGTQVSFAGSKDPASETSPGSFLPPLDART